MERNGSTNSPRRRSVGVTVFGIIIMLGYIINSFIRLVSSAITTKSLSLVHFAYAFLSPFKDNLIKSVIILIVSIFFFILGYNILKLKLWAYKAIKIYARMSIVLGIFFLIMTAKFYNPILMIAFGVIYIYFFTRPKVKRQFIGATEGSPEQ